MSRRKNTIEDYWKNVDIKGEDECWPFQGYKDKDDYGKFQFSLKDNQVSKRAHRLAYEYTYGLIEEGKFICHTCDNPSCCNPTHLFPGTPKDNTQDMFKKGRQGKPNAKLTNEKVAAIKADTRLQKDIAKDYGIHQTTVSYIKRGIYWIK